MGTSIRPDATAVRKPLSPPPKILDPENPTASVYEGLPFTMPRIPSPEEFAQLQGLPSHAIAQAKIPLLPPAPTVTVGEPKAVGVDEKTIARAKSGEFGLAAAVMATLALDHPHVGKGQPVSPDDIKAQMIRIARDVRHTTAPGTASTAGNIALGNFISPLSSVAAEAATEYALDRYAEGGGQVGEHANLFGAAAAGGDLAGNIAASKIPLPFGNANSLVRAERIATGAVHGAVSTGTLGAAGGALFGDEQGPAGAGAAVRQGAAGALQGAILGGALTAALGAVPGLSAAAKKFAQRVFGGIEEVHPGEQVAFLAHLAPDDRAAVFSNEDASKLFNAAGFYGEHGSATVTVPHGQRIGQGAEHATETVMKEAVKLLGPDQFRQRVNAEMTQRGSPSDPMAIAAAVEETARKVVAEAGRLKNRAGAIFPQGGSGSPLRPNAPRQAEGTGYTAPLDAGDNPRMLNVAKLGLSPEGENQLRAMLPATGEKVKVTQAETEALARELEMDPERLHRRINDWSGAEALAARNVIAQNTERIVDLSKITQDLTRPLAEREAAQRDISRITTDVRTMAGRLAGERSKTGRDLNAFKIIAKNTMDPAVWLSQAERVRGGLPLTPEHQTEILRLTGTKDRAGLISYVSGLAKTTPVEKALALWKAGLLTGLRTHEVNIASNVAMAGLETAKDIPAVIIDRIASLVTGERSVAPSFRGNVIEAAKGIGKGLRAAKSVIKNGDTAQMERWDFRQTNFKSPILQVYVDAVFRSLSAEDQIARGAAMGRALEEHSRLRARVLENADASKTFEQHLAGIRQNPPDDVVVKAIADAEYAVFQNDNAISRGVSAFKKALPPGGRAAADVVLPFVKTPTNVALRMTDYSPIGFFTTLAKQLKDPNQRALSQGLGRAVTGSALVWLGYSLASEGKATGSAPTSTTQRELQTMQGSGANRVRMGGKWVDVSRVSPAGALVAVGSQLYHATHTGEPQSPSEKAGAAAFSLGKVVLDQPMVSGLSGVLDAAKDPAHAGGRYVARTAGSVVPTIVSDLASSMDPNQRDVKGVSGSVTSRIPGARETLPEKLDAFGHPVLNQNQGAGAFLNALNITNAKDDALVQELVRLEVSLPQPAKTVTIGKGANKTEHQRTDEERRSLKQVIGAEVEKRLRKVTTSAAYDELTDEEKKVLLERIVGNVRQGEYAKEKRSIRERAATSGATPPQ